MKKLTLILFSVFLFLNLKSQIPAELWGMTASGGQHTYGTIFKTDLNGNNFSVQNTFGVKMGVLPYYSELCSATNGKLYGLTSSGGENNFGTLLEYDPVNLNYNKKFDFNGTTTGSSPLGNLIQASNGKLYGMTSSGGTNNLGVLFEFDLATNAYTKKIDFNGVANGAQPKGGLIETTGGKLYGMTYAGGANGKGIIFEFDINNSVFTKLVDFSGTLNGSAPYGDLSKGLNNKLYGMTYTGGVNNMGILFELDYTTYAFTKKLDFNGTINGANPTGKLTMANNNKLYGLTVNGGVFGYGTIFEYDPTANIYIKKLDFDSTNDGANPYGNINKSSSGILYGTTKTGGASNLGVLFSYDVINSVFTNLIDFNTFTGNGAMSGITQAVNGDLYGMSRNGGQNNLGVIFEIDPITNIYTKKIDFNTNTGINPRGSLIQATNGKLYGMNWQGGLNNAGVLFEFDPVTSAFVKKVDFNISNGAIPHGDLLQATNGKLYGLTQVGGTAGGGVLFEFDITTNIYSVLYNFGPSGNNPHGTLIQISNTKLYGLTRTGGLSNSGTIFEFDIPTSQHNVVFDLQDSKAPYGRLLKAPGGKLYALSSSGGVNALGTLFEFDPTNLNYVKKIDFNSSGNGNAPFGSLTNSSNGKIYGFTLQGGGFGNGLIFEYDQANSVFTNKVDLNSSTGFSPAFGHLLEVCQTITINTQPNGTVTCSNNSFSLITSATGTNISYQWFLNNTAVTSATNSVYSVSNSSLSNFGSYYCQISNGCNSVFTNTVSVNLPPVNVSSSANLICSGQSVTLTATGATNYTWSTNSTNQSIIVTPLSTTIYSITGTDNNGCSNTATLTQNVSVCTNLLSKQNEDVEISIFPNPFENFITVQVSQIEQKQLQVFNALGSLIISMNITKPKTLIDISDQKAGIYFIKLGSTTKKIIKE